MLHDQANEIKNRHKQSTRCMRLKRNQIPIGHKEERASFPIQSQYKDSKIHTPNPTLKKRKGGREEGRERRQEVALVRLLFLRQGKEKERPKRERGEGDF